MVNRRAVILGGASSAAVLLSGADDVAGAVPRRVIAVRSYDELRRAAAGARAGDHIVVASGRYAGSALTVTARGTSSAPIVIRAAEPLRAELRFRLRLTGEHITLQGMYLNGEGVDLGGSHNRVTRCRIRCDVGQACHFITGDHGEYDHCDVTVTPARYYGEIKCGVLWSLNEGDKPHLHGHVHHNHFHDFPPKLNVNDYYSACLRPIRVGGSIDAGPVSFFALIEHNLLERITPGHGEGSLEIKASDCTIRFNTLINSPKGRMQQRQGLRNRWEGNWVENCGGLNLRSTNAQALGNTVVSADMRIMAGDNDLTYHEWATSQDVHLAGNRAALVIGDDNGGRHRVPARRIRLEQHTGTVTLGRAVGLIDRRHSKSSVPFTPARKLTAAEVGPLAP